MYLIKNLYFLLHYSYWRAIHVWERNENYHEIICDWSLISKRIYLGIRYAVNCILLWLDRVSRKVLNIFLLESLRFLCSLHEYLQRYLPYTISSCLTNSTIHLLHQMSHITLSSLMISSSLETTSSYSFHILVEHLSYIPIYYIIIIIFYFKESQIPSQLTNISFKSNIERIWGYKFSIKKNGYILTLNNNVYLVCKL